MTPHISVLMPYRNAGDTVLAAAQSVLAQQGPSLELIAIDDRSSDAGPARMAELAAQDTRVRLLATSAAAAGLVPALELGRRAARGPFIGRMDADDLALPGRLAASLARLEADASLAVVGTQVALFPEALIQGGMARYVAWQNSLIEPDAHARERFVESPLCHPSVVMRGDALAQVGGYQDGAFPEDYELWLRFLAAGWGLAKVDRVLLRWRLSAGRASFNDARYGLECFRATKARFLAPILRADGRPVMVWGAGPVGRRFARELEPHGVRASAFIDIDPRKIGRQARGVAICGPEAAGSHALVLAAVGQAGARQLIRADLARRGLVEGRDFLAVA